MKYYSACLQNGGVCVNVIKKTDTMLEMHHKNSS